MKKCVCVSLFLVALKEQIKDQETFQVSAEKTKSNKIRFNVSMKKI